MAQSFETLPKIAQPFANAAVARAVIPNNATGTNRASLQEGFPEITAKPVADGGIPPNRKDFNGAYYLNSAYAFATQNGQYVTFDSDVSSLIGGYPKGAILWYVNNGRPAYLVESLVGNNTTADLTDTTKWAKVGLSAQGDSMSGHLSDMTTPQVLNIAIVTEEPETGVDGVIYAIVGD